MDCMLEPFLHHALIYLNTHQKRMLLYIDSEQIRDVIGRGGETINEIIEKVK